LVRVWVDLRKFAVEVLRRVQASLLQAEVGSLLW